MPPDPPSITCPMCGMISYNRGDVMHEFCGKCDMFHADMVRLESRIRSRGPYHDVVGEVVEMRPQVNSCVVQTVTGARYEASTTTNFTVLRQPPQDYKPPKPWEPARLSRLQLLMEEI